MYYMWVYRVVSICAGAFHSAQESKTYFNKTYDFSTIEYMHRNMKIRAFVYTNYTHTHTHTHTHTASTVSVMLNKMINSFGEGGCGSVIDPASRYRKVAGLIPL